jgi:uncharacterized protein YtpQ (UPF0354 family)
MGAMPREPEAFAEQVVEILRRSHPEFEVTLIGPREALVNGKHLDLENLHRLVRHDESRGREIVENYLDHLFASEVVGVESLPREAAERMVMPRIHHESIFGRLNQEQIAHVPFVNETVVLFVIDLPHMTVSVTTEQCVKWGVTPDDLEVIAKRNLDRYAPEIRMHFVQSNEGGRAAIVSEQDGYDASRLLMSDLHEALAPELGGDFLVATPSRDMFLAITPEPEPFVSRLHERVHRDFRRLPYPITDALFLVTRDGVAALRRN